MSEKRYELSFYIGPCPEKEAVDLADVIMDLPEFGAVGGGGIGIGTVADDDPLFADADEAA